MSFKKYGVCLVILLIIGMLDFSVAANVTASRAVPLLRPAVGQPGSTEAELMITAEELKSKMEKKQLVTVIDVRSTNNYVESANKIKGAIHVKLRRLQSRLTLPPLKDVPRDREVITYCACPSDEAGIEAAKVLSDAGFKRVRVLKGGWRLWLKNNGPIEPRGRN